ncbi:MAG: TetR/AcrR family transcriptional regulator, partial [Cyclobacteriaceae bacterium]|nr:TetR/AcrR family transcriptional regulator [Cyclobacteriaceae bacterium]
TQLDEEARRGTIRPIGAGQFLLNLMSMMIFPFVARPIVQKVIGLEMDPYFALMEARKTEVPKFIMQALRP